MELFKKNLQKRKKFRIFAVCLEALKKALLDAEECVLM